MSEAFLKIGFLTAQQCYDLLMRNASRDEIAAVAKQNAHEDPMRNFLCRPPDPDAPEFDSNALRQ